MLKQIILKYCTILIIFSIFDNGKGTTDLYNFFNANSGKINKIGKKNAGFGDTIMYFTKGDFKLEIISKVKNEEKYYGIEINMGPVLNNYKEQIKKNRS